MIYFDIQDIIAGALLVLTGLMLGGILGAISTVYGLYTLWNSIGSE